MMEGWIVLSFLLLTLVGLGLWLSPWWIRQLWPKVRYCLAKKQTVRAKLLELQAKHPLRMRDGGWVSLYDEEMFFTHYAVFKAEDGNQYTMTITKHQYQEMMQGTTGVLTRKGNSFVAFAPDQ